MSKSNVFENQIMALIFNGTAIPGLAVNATSSPHTQLYVALHSADPGESGVQNTNEINYTGYARVAVNRNATGWVITDNSVSPVDPIEFGEMTGGTPGTATHVTIGTAAAGAGRVLYRGALLPEVLYNEGVVPRIRTSSTITED